MANNKITNLTVKKQWQTSKTFCSSQNSVILPDVSKAPRNYKGNI